MINAKRGLQQSFREPMKSKSQKAKTLDPLIEGEKRFKTSKLMLKYQNTVRKKSLSEMTSQVPRSKE